MQTSYAPGAIDSPVPGFLRHGVSWSAVFAGAIAATALTLILLAFGAGLGFASFSLWPGGGMAAKGFTIVAGIWLIIVQWLSSAFGGYLTGRLRCKWTNIHTHEVFFRDTAHGFLSWALATLAAALILSLVTAHAMTNVTRMAAAGEIAAMRGPHEIDGKSGGLHAYYADSLFRPSNATSASAASNNATAAANARGEAERILMAGARPEGVSDQDQMYLSQLVTAQTGVAPADAEKRVGDVLAQEKNDEIKVRQTADDARKAAASFGIFGFLALLIGAFISSAAAALGGSHRDEDWRMVP